MSYSASINLSSPYYLLYLFIVDLAFTPDSISALLFCTFVKQGTSNAQYLISLCLSSVLSHPLKAQFMTPKQASILPCLAPTYQLCLV